MYKKHYVIKMIKDEKLVTKTVNKNTKQYFTNNYYSISIIIKYH